MASTKSSDDILIQCPEEEFLFLSSSDEEEENGLSHWEFINPSDANDDIGIDCGFDIDDLSTDSSENGVSDSLHPLFSFSTAIPQSNLTQEDTHFDADDDIGIDYCFDIDDITTECSENGLSDSLHSPLSSSIANPQSNQTLQVAQFDFTSLDQARQHVAYVGYQYRDDDNDNDDDQEDDDEDIYGDGYDLDDELVPWSVSGKLGRQRMRKLGKRGFARMYNSKKSPFLYTKPGCVHGKHGLGLKHSC